MGVFHVFEIVQMVPNCAKEHIYQYLKLFPLLLLQLKALSMPSVAYHFLRRKFLCFLVIFPFKDYKTYLHLFYTNGLFLYSLKTRFQTYKETSGMRWVNR